MYSFLNSNDIYHSTIKVVGVHKWIKEGQWSHTLCHVSLSVLSLSVRRSVHMQQLASPFTYFNEIWYFEVLLNISIFQILWRTHYENYKPSRLQIGSTSLKVYKAKNLRKENLEKKKWNTCFMNNLLFTKKKQVALIMLIIALQFDVSTSFNL